MSTPRIHWLSWLGIAAAWLAWGLVHSSSLHVEARMDWSQAFAYGMPDALIWLGLTPLVAAVAHRYPIRPGQLRRRLTLHAGAAAAAALVHASIDASLYTLLMGQGIRAYLTVLTKLLTHNTHHNVLIYFMVSGFAHYVAHSRQLLERERQSAHLQSQLSEARLQTLRQQVRPHFLFNALHTISGLMTREPAIGQKVVRRLGELLRASLKSDERQEIPLADELELVRAYLEVEQARFGDRLSTRIDADPQALSCAVPALVLQPLVENAVRHGISRNAAGGCIEVEARCAGPRLELRVRDDGPGLAAAASHDNDTGIGLANTRARLRELYADEQELRLVSREGGGVSVTISIPRREALAA